MDFIRKFALAAAIGSIFTTPLAIANASAEDFPSKPVTLVVPFGPGGLVDTQARALANELGKVWKNGVIVENVPGAANNIAAHKVAKAPADGYTILVGNNSPLVNNRYLFKEPGYNAEKDFKAVVNMYVADSIFIVRSDFPAKTFKEFLALAKEKPGSITYGSQGIGSNIHIDVETIADISGIKLHHIAYKGDVAPIVARREVDSGISGAGSGMITNGSVHALAVLSEVRSQILPNVPTIKEAGGPAYISRPFFGLVVPKNTPQPVVNTIAKEVARISSDPAFVKKYIIGAGLEPLVLGPNEFEAFLKEQRDTADKVIPKLNIEMN